MAEEEKTAGEGIIRVPLSRYIELLESEQKLDALDACGVDNWEGYGEAMRMLEDEED